MLTIALAHRPRAACIVPERREERTTEGGLDASGQRGSLAYFVDKLGSANIRVSLFIEPSEEQVAAAVRLAELNIGHFLVGEAIFTGLEDSVRRMRALMDEAR